MGPLGRQPQVVRKGGRDLHRHAAPRALAAQEVGLHLQVAVAEQQHVEAMAHRPPQRPCALRLGDGPVGVRPLLAPTPQRVQRLTGIAAMEVLQRRRRSGVLAVGVPVGQQAPLHQGGEAARQDLGVEIACRRRRGEFVRHVAGRDEPVEQGRDLLVHYQPQARHGVQRQHPSSAKLCQMGVDGPADQHGRPCDRTRRASLRAVSAWLTAC